MNNLNLHFIIEQIKQKGEFPFNVEDVKEDLGEILGFFGIHELFDEEEKQVIKEDLIEIAMAEQAAEVVRMTAKAGWL